MKPASPSCLHLCHRAEERDFTEVQLSACALKAPIRKVNEIQGRDAGEPESAGGLIDGLHVRVDLSADATVSVGRPATSAARGD